MNESPNRPWPRFALGAGRLARFSSYVGQRFLDDGCPRLAAGLSYISLLAIVPLFALGLVVLASFPAFESWRADVQDFLVDNLLPDTGVEITAHLETFVANASAMTAPGLIGLVVVVLLLMANINGAINQIWRVAEPRPLALRLAVYWALLTLGPLLIGASLSVSGYAFAAIEWFGGDSLPGVSNGLSRLISMLLAVLGFALLYFLVPSRSVHLGHALIGGLIAAGLFELLKVGFGLYLRHFPTYQMIYGAVSTIPIFLVWMYLSWAVALFGAEITAALPERRAVRALGHGAANPGARLALALSLLTRLERASRSGDKPRERQLGRGLPAVPAEIDATLRRLRRAGYIARVIGGRWVLSRGLENVTLHELAQALDLGLSPGVGWHPMAEAAVKDLAAVSDEFMTRNLAALLRDFDTESDSQS